MSPTGNAPQKDSFRVRLARLIQPGVTDETPQEVSPVTEEVSKPPETPDEATPPPPPPPQEPVETIIENQTARRIMINTSKGCLMLAPLEERKVELGEKEKPALREWERLNVLRLEPVKAAAAKSFENIITGVIAAGFVYAIAGAFVSDKKHFNADKVWFHLGETAVTGADLYWWGAPLLGIFILIGILVLSSEKRGIILRKLAQVVSLLIVFLIAVGLPFLGVYTFVGDLFGGPSLTTLGRWVQLIFIVVASLLPALLYFLFDRQQLGTLQEKFRRDILRLDPYVYTLADVKAKYGKQINEVYGSSRTAGAGRLLADTRWPITVATLVITLGWFLTLLPSRREITLTGEVLELITPQRTAISFGFLGAYLYGLNMVLRRYVLGDLRPKAYSSLTVRIFIVFVIAWLLPEIFPPTLVLPLAFLAGIIPETLLTYFEEKLRNARWPARASKKNGEARKKTPLAKLGFEPELELKEKQPLTRLEGIDLYDRARLMDEGVTSIENLAHHDLIDLMLQTRIPTQRIVDWVDQAILYLHLGGDEHAGQLMKNLRRYGIRTATGLQRACEFRENHSVLLGVLHDTGEPAPAQPDGNGRADDGVGTHPATVEPDCEHVPRRLRVITSALEDAEWLDYIRHWRDYRLRVKQVVTDPKQIYPKEFYADAKADDHFGGNKILYPL